MGTVMHDLYHQQYRFLKTTQIAVKTRLVELGAALLGSCQGVLYNLGLRVGPHSLVFRFQVPL